MNSARRVAVDVVYAVCEQGISLDEALEQHRHMIKDSESGMVQDIVYGSVRWYLAYLSTINQQLKKPFKPKDRRLNALLVTALYQIDYTQHAPHAIVNESVKLTSELNRKWAASVVNAILRGYIRLDADRPIHDEGWNHRSFPPWLLNKIKEDWPTYFDAIITETQAKPPMTLRVNLQQQSREAALKTLSAAELPAKNCQDSESGITLEKPVSVRKLPGFEHAHLSVQDESAQLAAPLLDIKAGHRVLDACAAPGGKSLHCFELAPSLGA